MYVVFEQVKIKKFILVIFSLLAVSVSADKTVKIGGIDGLDPKETGQKYPVLLALSGGGARGLTTIGILKAFEEKGIVVSGVAGTSMGGIIGGLYASGYSPNQLDSIANELNFRRLFANSPPRNSMLLTKREGRENHLISIRLNNFNPVIPKALTAGQELTSLLTSLTAKPNYQCGADFKKLPIPFVTISTDIVSGKQVVLSEGSITDALRATMAFPLAFTGVEKDGMILMDGGIVTPIPVDLARTLSDSVSFVVAVNTASILLSKDAIKDPVDLADQVTTIMTSDKLQSQLETADFVLTPPINDFISADFDRKDELVKIGYEYGLAQADSIIAAVKSKSPENRYSNVILDTGLRESAHIKLNEMIPDKEFSESEFLAVCKQFVQQESLFQLEVVFPDMDTSRTVDTILVRHLSEMPVLDLSLKFEGNNVISSEELAKTFVGDADYISSSGLQEGLKRIIKRYEELGYDLVIIKEVWIGMNTPVIIIELDEAIIKTIDVEQNEHTKDWFIRSYFPLEQGKPYSTEGVSNGIRNIYGTDLFARVTVDALPSDDGVVVKIGVEEKESTQLRIGWHWDDEYESEEFLELKNDNFMGIGLEYLLHGRYAPDRQHYFFSFKADRVLQSYITSRFKIYRTILNRQLYDISDEPSRVREERTTGVSLSVGQQIARLGTVSSELFIENVDYFDPDFTEKVQYDIQKLQFRSLFETFDRIPFPTHGNRHEFRLTFAGKVFGGDVEYTKFFTSHESYIQFGKYINYHPYFALGASRSGLPPTEQFYLGGQHSFAGFRTEQLAGDKMVQFSNELRVKLPLHFFLIARYDLGEVYNSTDQIKLRNLRNGFGASIALDSPLGPLEFGYGIVNSDQEETYLNLGFRF
ncbi:MAG: hypothetical protein DWP97_09280 [Calditrichaeota bacterium]|nr:MAG: hypothetical protein DWP97_09280 [Calditrichota bacterium]